MEEAERAAAAVVVNKEGAVTVAGSEVVAPAVVMVEEARVAAAKVAETVEVATAAATGAAEKEAAREAAARGMGMVEVVKVVEMEAAARVVGEDR